MARQVNAPIETASAALLDAHHRRLAARVVQSVSWASRVPKQDIRGRKRYRKAASARTAVYWVLRELGLSYPAIGRLMRRDHATVIWGVRSFEGALVTEQPWAHEILQGLR